MNNKFFIFYFFIFFIVGTLAIIPFTKASCSLGASPLEMEARAKPGQTVEINWNFFNLRGDRLTHVLITRTAGPDWEIKYTPDSSTRDYDVAGIIQPSLENFAMEKSSVVLTKPSGTYVVHPNASEGYIKIDNQEKILITLPNDAKIGKQEEFVFTALGSCFGETGAVSASVATELKVKITPSTEYYEKAVGENNIGKKILGFFTQASSLPPVLSISLGLTLLLVIIFIILIVLARRKLKKRNNKRK